MRPSNLNIILFAVGVTGSRMLHKHHGALHKRQASTATTVIDVVGTATAIDLVDEEVTPVATATFLLQTGQSPDQAVASEAAVLSAAYQGQPVPPVSSYTLVTSSALIPTTLIPIDPAAPASSSSVVLVPVPQKQAIPEPQEPASTSSVAPAQQVYSISTPTPAAPQTTQQPTQQPSATSIPSNINLPTTAIADLQSDSSTYQGLVLQHHNIHRSNHSANPLVWNDTLANYAEQTAKTCVYAHSLYDFLYLRVSSKH